MVHIHNRILFNHKKEANPTICNNTMELEGIMLSDISQVKKDKYQMISLICAVLTSKQKLKEHNSSTLTEPKTGLTVTKGKGTGESGWEGREKGNNGH